MNDADIADIVRVVNLSCARLSLSFCSGAASRVTCPVCRFSAWYTMGDDFFGYAFRFCLLCCGFQIKSCDTDGDGKLTFSEVIEAMKN
jgi:hypothetical protein